MRNNVTGWCCRGKEKENVDVAAILLIMSRITYDALRARFDQEVDQMKEEAAFIQEHLDLFERFLLVYTEHKFKRRDNKPTDGYYQEMIGHLPEFSSVSSTNLDIMIFYGQRLLTLINWLNSNETYLGDFAHNLYEMKEKVYNNDYKWTRGKRDELNSVIDELLVPINQAMAVIHRYDEMFALQEELEDQLLEESAIQDDENTAQIEQLSEYNSNPGGNEPSEEEIKEYGRGKLKYHKKFK